VIGESSAERIGELAERYWRYVFHHQSIGPTVGYHDTQSVNRLMDFGLTGLAWLASETDRPPNIWARACFSSDNPALFEWLAPLSRIRSDDPLCRFLQSLATSTNDWNAVRRTCDRFSSNHQGGIVEHLLDMAEELPAASLSLRELFGFFRLLAAEMLGAPAGSWEARLGHERVKERLGLQATRPAVNSTETVEINLFGLHTEAEVQASRDVRLLPGRRNLPPNWPLQEQLTEIDPSGSRLAVRVSAKPIDLPFTAMRRAREILAVLISRFGGGTPIDLALSCFVMPREDGSYSVDTLSRERRNVINAEDAKGIEKVFNRFYTQNPGRVAILQKAAQLHSVAYFEEFYPWSSSIGVLHDFAAVEAMTQLDRAIDPWSLLQAYVTLANDLTQTWNLAFLLEVYRYRKWLPSTMDALLSSLRSALDNRRGSLNFAWIRETMVTSGQQLLELPCVSALFAGWLAGWTSGCHRAEWLAIEQRRALTLVQQARLLRNRVAHSGAIDIPGATAVALFLNSCVSRLWRTLAIGVEPHQIVTAAEKYGKTGIVSSEGLLQAVAAGFHTGV